MSWFSRLKNALHTRPLDESLEDEIQDHLERRAAAFRAEGLTPAEARRRALAAFGNVTRVREQSRELRMWAGLDSTIQDVRYACRTMRRSPAFALTALVSLSLAIGASTAIYAIVNAAMLRPLPVPDPQRVFTIGAPALDPGSPPGSGEIESFSYPLYLQFREAAGDSARLIVFGPSDRADAQDRDATAPTESVRQQFVSGAAFETLRVPPAAGRIFSSDDDRAPGVARTVVLSFEYWQRRYHADPGVVGRPIILNNREHQIVGVAAKGFFGIEPGKFVDVWLPVMTFDPGVFSNSAATIFRIVGRLDDRSSPALLQARLQPVFREHQQDVIAQSSTMPAAALKAYSERGIRVQPGGIGTSDFQRSFARPLWIVWGVAAAILLVACANVASLLLSRAAARSSEMSLRTSLGATHGRLVRQLLTESLLLSGLATGLGWLLASATAPWLVTWLSTDGDPIRLALVMDTRVLLFCAGVCTATSLIVGLLPAWHGAQGRDLSAVTRGSSDRRLVLGRIFVSVQVAFVLCLVVAGGSFVFSLHKLFAVELGFDPAHVTVLTMRSDLGPKQEGLKATQELQRQLSLLPAVQGTAVAWTALFTDNRRTEQIVLKGSPPSERQETFYRISPGYFATLDIPVLDGRDFDVRDTDGVQPIPTIVNRAFARRYFGKDAVLGMEFQRRTDNARHLIVGVAADAHYLDLRHGLQPMVYFPMKPPRFFTLYVRSTLDPASVMQLVKQDTSAATPGIHVVAVTTLRTLIGDTLLREKLLAGVGGVFATLGLVLVAIGLFGLLSYSVVRRTKEIGIRAALGARRSALISLVLKELLGMTAGGLTVGLVGSIALMRLVHSQLFGVATVDPVVMAAAAAVFLVTASAAVVLPAYRVATMDPIIALRRD